MLPLVVHQNKYPYRLTDRRVQGTLSHIFSRLYIWAGPVLAWTCITNTWKEDPSGFFREKMSES